jgi:hypothetical protein
LGQQKAWRRSDYRAITAHLTCHKWAGASCYTHCHGVKCSRKAS